MKSWRHGDLEVRILSSCGGISISLLLRLRDRYLLVDAGDGVARDLSALGIAADALDAIAITHDHGDHAAGLPALLWWLRLAGRRTRLALLLPSDAPLARGGVDLFFRALGERARLDVDRRTLVAGRGETLGPFAVTPFPVRHRRSQSDPLGLLMDAFGLRIEAEGLRVVISGDTGPSAELEREVAGADLAVIEAGAGDASEPLDATHLTRREAERLGRRARGFLLYHEEVCAKQRNPLRRLEAK